MGISAPNHTTDEHLLSSLESIETKEAEIDLASLTEQEFRDIMQETIPPELEILIFQKAQLEKAIQQSDHDWSTFLETNGSLSKGAYIQQEKKLLSSLTTPFEYARDLKNTFLTYCSTKITQTDTQYRYIKKTLLPKATGSTKVLLERTCLALEDIKGKWEEIQSVYQSDLTDLSQLLRNKKDQKKYLLMKQDPWKRYEKEELKKAKVLAEEGPQRSAYAAMKYFTAGPITRADAGKCGITNHSIEENEKILAGMQATMQARQKDINKNKTSLAIWKEDTKLFIPDAAETMVALTSLTENLTSDMVTAGIDTSRMQHITK